MVTMHFRAVNFKAGVRLKEYAKNELKSFFISQANLRSFCFY